MASVNGSCTLFMKAGIPAPSQSIPLHTYGTAAASGSAYSIMPLVLAEGANSTGTNDNITLFIKQSDKPPGEITLYVGGSTTGGVRKTNTFDLFLQHGAGSTDSMDLYVKGLGVTTHVQSDLVNTSDGFNFYSEYIPLTIQREYEATTSTTKLFIEGQQTRTSTTSIPLNILTPSGVPTASLNLCFNTGSPNAELNLYTRGY